MRTIALLPLIALLAGTARADRPDGDTLGTQVKGAAIGFALGGGLGVITGLALGGKEKDVAISAGATLGIALGIPIGVQKTADSAGGTGKSWGTSMGALIGISAAGAAIYGMTKDKGKETTEKIVSTLVIVLACVTAGPIIGYRATGQPENPPMMLSVRF